MYHAPSPYQLPSHPSPYRIHHTMPKPMRDKMLFWMASNDHFQNKFHLFINQKYFWMIHLNDHFIFKTMYQFVGSEFLVSHVRLHKPRNFYSLSPLDTMSDHNCRVFYPRGDLSLLTNARHIFSLPFYSIVRLCWTLSL